MESILLLPRQAASPNRFRRHSVDSEIFLPAKPCAKRRSFVLLVAGFMALFIAPGFGCVPADEESLAQYPYPDAMVRIVKMELRQEGVGGAKRPLLVAEVKNLAESANCLRLTPWKDDLNVGEEVVKERRKAGVRGTYVLETQIKFADESEWSPIAQDGWIPTERVSEDRQHMPGEAHLAAGCTRSFCRLAEASADCSWRVYIRDPAGGRIDAKTFSP